MTKDQITQQQITSALGANKPVYIQANAPLAYAVATPQQFVQPIGITSPPGSELSFRQTHGSELSSIAGRAVEQILAPGLAINTTAAPKVAHPGRGIIPITPETSTLKNNVNPYANIGHISPGYQPNIGQNNWTQAVHGPQPQQVPNVEPLEHAVNNEIPVISEDAADGKQAEDKKATKSELADVNKIGDMKPMQPKQSNPHCVPKEVANKLHAVISGWYPNQAGKLTGMFLQNHDTERVVKYLAKQDRLKKKIDTFSNLLSNQTLNANKSTSKETE